MEKARYAEVLKGRLRKKKYDIQEYSFDDKNSLSYIARRDSFPNTHKFFIVGEFSSLNFKSLMQFTSDNLEYVSNMFKFRPFFPPFVFSYTVAIADCLVDNIREHMANSKYTQYRDMPDQYQVNDYPIVINLAIKEWLSTPIGPLPFGGGHTLGGTIYYDMPEPNFRRIMNEIIQPID